MRWLRKRFVRGGTFLQNTNIRALNVFLRKMVTTIRQPASFLDFGVPASCTTLTLASSPLARPIRAIEIVYHSGRIASARRRPKPLQDAVLTVKILWQLVQNGAATVMLPLSYRAVIAELGAGKIPPSGVVAVDGCARFIPPVIAVGVGSPLELEAIVLLEALLADVFRITLVHVAEVKLHEPIVVRHDGNVDVDDSALCVCRDNLPVVVEVFGALFRIAGRPQMFRVPDGVTTNAVAPAEVRLQRFEGLPFVGVDGSYLRGEARAGDIVFNTCGEVAIPVPVTV